MGYCIYLPSQKGPHDTHPYILTDSHAAPTDTEHASSLDTTSPVDINSRFGQSHAGMWESPQTQEETPVGETKGLFARRGHEPHDPITPFCPLTHSSVRSAHITGAHAR